MSNDRVIRLTQSIQHIEKGMRKFTICEESYWTSVTLQY